MVDKEGVPILVEVKRSTDTRIRREVVAQMLDYACRASSLNISKLQELFKRNNPDSDFCDNDDFWSKVASNLASGRMRLVFAADEIPDTLRILIEFLDLSMGDIDVYGVEIKQFTNGDVLLLSSDIIGNSVNDPRKPASSLKAPPRQWTKEEFTALFDARNLSAIKPLAEKIIDLFNQREDMEWVFGVGTKCIDYLAMFKGRRFFSLEFGSNKDIGYFFVILINTKALPYFLGDDWTQDRVKKELLRFPSEKWAKEKRYIWGDAPDKEWLHIDLRGLREEPDKNILIDTLLKFADIAGQREKRETDE